MKKEVTSMKRLISLFLSLLLFVPTLASAENYASMTTDELFSILDAVRVELTNRELDSNEEKVLVDADGIKWYIKGDPILSQSWNGSYTLTINTIITNSSNLNLGINLNELYINGWSVSNLACPSLAAGKKEKYEITLYNVDVDCELSNITQLEDIEFHCYTFNADSYATLTSDIVTRFLFK